MPFATMCSMMYPPGGRTTISLFLASLSKLLSARWWSPVQRMKHQWRYFSLGRCSSEAMCTPKGASLSCIWECCSVCLQSDSSLSCSELNSQKAVGVVVGFTCSKHTPRVCLYRFAQLKPVESWRFGYFIPPSLPNTGTSSSFMLAMTAVSSEVHNTTDNKRERLCLVGRSMCDSSFDLTQSISAARVLLRSFTLDLKTDGFPPH